MRETKPMPLLLSAVSEDLKKRICRDEDGQKNQRELFPQLGYCYIYGWIRLVSVIPNKIGCEADEPEDGDTSGRRNSKECKGAGSQKVKDYQYHSLSGDRFILLHWVAL
jgi:hypothetical protein